MENKPLDILISQYGEDIVMEMMYAYICAMKDILSTAQEMSNGGDSVAIDDIVFPRFEVVST